MKRWTYDPHSGGSKILPKAQEAIEKQVEVYASTRPWYSEIQLKVRFKGQFCYIDTVEKRGKDERLFPLCRLRNLSRGWSLSLFTYSNDRYEPCVLPGGNWEGTIEEALSVCDPFII